MKIITTLILAAYLSVPLWAAYKNLQVLPKNISSDELKSTMKSISTALGVQCSFCHNMTAMDADTDKKKKAVNMLRMTNDINTKYLTGTAKVMCITCHRGRPVPE